MIGDHNYFRILRESVGPRKQKIARSGVRTHADICPLDLKSNPLTTQPYRLAGEESWRFWYNEAFWNNFWRCVIMFQNVFTCRSTSVTPCARFERIRRIGLFSINVLACCCKARVATGAWRKKLWFRLRRDMKFKTRNIVKSGQGARTL